MFFDVLQRFQPLIWQDETEQKVEEKIQSNENDAKSSSPLRKDDNNRKDEDEKELKENSKNDEKKVENDQKTKGKGKTTKINPLIRPKNTRKSDALEEYLHLTASAVKINYPSVDVSAAELIEKARKLPFYRVHDALTRYMMECLQWEQIEQQRILQIKAAAIAAKEKENQETKMRQQGGNFSKLFSRMFGSSSNKSNSSSSSNNSNNSSSSSSSSNNNSKRNDHTRSRSTNSLDGLGGGGNRHTKAGHTSTTSIGTSYSDITPRTHHLHHHGHMSHSIESNHRISEKERIQLNMIHEIHPRATATGGASLNLGTLKPKAPPKPPAVSKDRYYHSYRKESKLAKGKAKVKTTGGGGKRATRQRMSPKDSSVNGVAGAGNNGVKKSPMSGMSSHDRYLHNVRINQGIPSPPIANKDPNVVSAMEKQNNEMMDMMIGEPYIGANRNKNRKIKRYTTDEIAKYLTKTGSGGSVFGSKYSDKVSYIHAMRMKQYDAYKQSQSQSQTQSQSSSKQNSSNISNSSNSSDVSLQSNTDSIRNKNSNNSKNGAGKILNMTNSDNSSNNNNNNANNNSSSNSNSNSSEMSEKSENSERRNSILGIMSQTSNGLSSLPTLQEKSEKGSAETSPSKSKKANKNNENNDNKDNTSNLESNGAVPTNANNNTSTSTTSTSNSNDNGNNNNNSNSTTDQKSQS